MQLATSNRRPGVEFRIVMGVDGEKKLDVVIQRPALQRLHDVVCEMLTETAEEAKKKPEGVTVEETLAMLKDALDGVGEPEPSKDRVSENMRLFLRGALTAVRREGLKQAGTFMCKHCGRLEDLDVDKAEGILDELALWPEHCGDQMAAIVGVKS